MKKEFLITSLLFILLINCTPKMVDFSTSNYDEILKNEKKLNDQIENAKSKLDSAIGLCFYKTIDDTSVDVRYQNIIMKYSTLCGNLEKCFSSHTNIHDTMGILYSKCIYNMGTF